jgi:DNA-binding CsgD family transcriptional regulator
MSQIPTKCFDCPYRGRHIYVVGSQRFERELMASYLELHTASKQHQVNRLENIPIDNQDVPYGQKMILIDANRLFCEELLTLFLSNAWQDRSHNLLALFNVLRDSGIEKEGMKNGARGFLYDDDSVEDLINGICAINSGELWISRKILSECLQESYVGKELPDPFSHPLSNREVEILKFLATGATNVCIADQMCISPHTVKTHLQHIFNKLNVDNRLQAVLWAKENL